MGFKETPYNSMRNVCEQRSDIILKTWSDIMVSQIHIVAGHDRTLIIFSRIMLVYYCKCCNLSGYFTRYLFGTKTALSSFACIQKRKTFLLYG